MKRIKKNSLRIAILLITIGSMAILYWYGFYKQFDKKTIPSNADGIVIADVKNIRNHFAFLYLKNPSQWEFGTNNTADKNHFNLSDYGIETPDYLTAFHIQSQPFNQWCLTAVIENEAVFERALVNAQFVKTEYGKPFINYYSKTANALIIRYENQILYCANTLNNYQDYAKTAENLFIKNRCFDAKKIEKIIENSKAVTIWIKKNNLFDDDGIINLSLKENGITAEGKFNWKTKFRKTSAFIQNPVALLSLGFNFDILNDHNILKTHSVKINKMIGFNLDSILVHHPAQTELLLHSIIEKKDSAISYEYDDDFNPIKKVVVHTSREPSFYFSVQTDNSQKIYNYLKSQNIIDSHQTFLNFPLAVTKTFVKNNSLIFEANHSKAKSLKPANPKIGYLKINFNKLQPKDWRFLIAKNKSISILQAFETLEINLIKKNDLIYFEALLKTEKEKNLTEILK